MKVKDVKGGLDYMKVFFEDGREVTVLGELLVDGFVIFKKSVKNWTAPEKKPISESEQREILDAIRKEGKKAGMKILIE